MATAFVRSTDGSRARWRDGTAAIARWVLIAGLLTAGLVALRDDLEKAHVALAYLLVVLIGSARVGRTGGIALALVCFFCFNFFLLPPYHTLMVADPLDWLVLLAFLITSLVATELLHHAQFQATVASERTEEVNRLSVLGAETLNAGRAEEATQAIARVLQSTLAIDACELFEAVPGTTTFRLIGHAARAGFANEDVRTNDIFAYATENDVVVVQRTGGAIHVLATASGMANESALDQVDACVIVIPLRVRDRAVGILRLSHEVPIQLSPPQRRFALALAYYAALGVERLRLSAEAERAQALAAADQLKDAFVAAVSHDLRTPLTTIKGLAHELSVEGDERAEIKDRVHSQSPSDLLNFG